jgi:hypothetical protein
LHAYIKAYQPEIGVDDLKVCVFVFVCVCVFLCVFCLCVCVCVVRVFERASLKERESARARERATEKYLGIDNMRVCVRARACIMLLSICE